MSAPFVLKLSDSFPAIISRRDVGRFTGGLIAPRTMANLDSLGQGPRQRLRLGRNVGYTREAFLDWLAGRLEVEDAS